MQKHIEEKNAKKIKTRKPGVPSRQKLYKMLKEHSIELQCSHRKHSKP